VADAVQTHRGRKEEVLDLVLTSNSRNGEIAAGPFTLRPARRSDVGLFTMYAGDRRVAEATQSIPHPLPPGASEAFVERVVDGKLAGLPEVLGVISLKPMDRAQAEIGFWVAPAFWNTGIASKAVAALVQANPLGIRTYFAEVFQDNPGSAKVLTKQGFGYLGDAETFSVARGALVSTWTYLRNLG
jgi:RimJ/RimL family protein N-acetyltransferase